MSTYYVKEKVENTFRVEREYDLAGRIIATGTVVSGKIAQGMTGVVNGKRYVVERIEVNGVPIDYLLQNESGDLVIYGRELNKDDIHKGLLLYLESIPEKE